MDWTCSINKSSEVSSEDAPIRPGVEGDNFAKFVRGTSLDILGASRYSANLQTLEVSLISIM